MLKLDHPNIAKLLYCESDNDFRYYALELCKASLDKLFLDSNDPQKYDGPIPRHIEIFHQLAVGLEYIHSMKLIHRDIKPDNVLIFVPSTDQGNKIIIKWAYFGLLKGVNEKGTYTLSEMKGKNIWLAPESLKWITNLQEGVEVRGTTKSDVFALGLVYGYLFLNGQHLYGSVEQVRKNIIEKNPTNMLKIEGKLRQLYEKDLLSKMLEDDPDKRISSEEVVEQLKSINNKLTEKNEELRHLCARDSSSRLIEKINDLICLDIDVNEKDIIGRNALHNLCEKNSSSNLIDAIQLLIQLGIDVNAKDKYGQDALHRLCRNNSNSNLIEAIQLLIQRGIDVNAKDDDGLNALHYLCCNHSNSKLIDAIQLLIQRGIDVNAKDKDGENALHYLCRYNSNSNLIDLIQLLIQRGIDANAKDKDGENVLHYLCRYNSNSNLIDAIQLLIQLKIHVVSNVIDARTLIRCNNGIINKDEILKLLDEAALVQSK
ncbi:death-associated protein kinase 1 isoform X2 [Daphnia magna]|nr:death-associated protein kinase 1 isoform X2 [Daphnia magna]